MRLAAGFALLAPIPVFVVKMNMHYRFVFVEETQTYLAVGSTQPYVVSLPGPKPPLLLKLGPIGLINFQARANWALPGRNEKKIEDFKGVPPRTYKQKHDYPCILVRFDRFVVVEANSRKENHAISKNLTEMHS